MCTPLAKLAIGIWATMATGFYYLAAAPPASAIDVCGPGNFSSACGPGGSATTQSPESLREPVASPLATPELIVPSPLAIPDPLPPVPPVFESPIIVQPTVPPTVPPPVVASPPIVEPTVPPPVVELSPPTAAIIIPPSVLQPFTPAPSPIPSPPPIVLPSQSNFGNIYRSNNNAVRTTAIPEPGTVVALLLIGVGIICSGKKRNKQVGQQR